MEQHAAVTTFFAMDGDARRRVLIWLCQFALSVWDEHCKAQGEMNYVETSLGTLQVVDPTLPHDAIEAVLGGQDVQGVEKRYYEPITAIDDRDLRLPRHIQYAFHSIYNLFSKYVAGDETDDWLIVEQALSAATDETRWAVLLQEAVDAARN